MKEWIMKHPILTFLLADSLICGVLNTIRAFAPKEVTVGVDGSDIDVEIEDEDDGHTIGKEESK